MSKFNTKMATLSKSIAGHPAATQNFEGGLAFKVGPETELYLRACTSLLEDKFYTEADLELQAIRALVRKVDRKFVLQLANYARNAMGLRSLPIMLLAEAAALEKEKGEPKPDVRAYAPKILRRADEPAEVLAYGLKNLWDGERKTIPHALVKGIADALKQFDEYELAKYDRLLKSREVKLRDVFRIARPKPDTPEQADLFRRAVKGELKQPGIWEITVANAGRSASSEEERRAALRDAWNQVAPKMGMLALLRNLRNFEAYGAEEAKRIAIERFTNAEAVQKSRILPFQWYTAYKHIDDPELKDALHEAVELSAKSVTPWSGRTCILVDVSGSMLSRLSAKSQVIYLEAAAILGAMAHHLSPAGSRVGVFNTEFRWIDVTKRDTVITNVNRMVSLCGGGTYAYKAFETLLWERRPFDRVILLSDMQCYNESPWDPERTLAKMWRKYRQTVSPSARLFSIDMAGYGTIQTVPGDESVTLLAGWSERVLDLITHLDRGSTALDEIKSRW